MARKREWTYDARESVRRKHRWDKPYAGFVYEESRGREIGKCSAQIDDELAQCLLDDAIEHSPSTWRKKYPKELFNVHHGVPYRAHYVTLGSYHGFPEKPRQVPPDLLEKLRERATKQDCEAEFDAWMAQEDL